ncbi:HNH endonuclease family protein [Spirosoma litoris]
MRRIIKSADSKIIERQLTYKDGNNDELRQLLAKEQYNICAYTETHFEVSNDAHIEHFNPTLKNTDRDGYTNWFLVKSLWNVRKSNRWIEPILHPTAEDLEKRILYFDGNYAAADPEDIEAQNLIRLLDLDNAKLSDQRKRYIKSKKQQIDNLNQSAQQYIDNLIIDYPEGVYFIRALEEELAVKVNFGLLKTT